MKGRISTKAAKFKRGVSPVRQIMSFADPQTIRRLGFQVEDVISFAGGWVNHEAPPELVQAYREMAFDPNLFHEVGAYSPTLGTPECKRAIITFERLVYGMGGLQMEQIAVGAGSTQLTAALLQTLLNPGDSILLLDPSYCNYPMQIVTAVEARIIRFPVLDTESWTYTADEQAQEFYDFILQHKPRVILLVAPDNPTSQVPSDEFVGAALAAARKTGAFVVIDFAYKSILFETVFPDYFTKPPDDNFIAVHSNSKWTKSLGRRLGWVEAPEFVVQALESIQNSTLLCPDTMHQHAFARFVELSSERGTLRAYIQDTIERYRIAARVTLESIAEYLGIPALQPQGGIYTVVPVGMDGAKFVDRTLRSCGVLLVPGWGFGRTTADAVRISYGPLVNDHDRIREGMRRVGIVLRGESAAAEVSAA